MPKGYHHLTYDQRCQLQTLKDRGESFSSIAKILGVHHSTIYREVARNSTKTGYRYKKAHGKALKRCRLVNHQKSKMIPQLIVIIVEMLMLQWSPVQISGRLKKLYQGQGVSHETIYRYIRNDKKNGGSLYKELRHQGKRYHKRGKNRAGKGCIPGRIDISERPLIVKEKSRLGDWEVDTIIGAEHKGAIVSMTERHSKLTMLMKVEHRTALEVEKALTLRLGEVKDCVFTVTSDNGKEFANHIVISKALDAEFYFARPYHSWERGLNEHTNGLVRQYIPKKTCFNQVSHEKVQEVENLLNNRPRKSLQFMTPMEVFHQKRSESSLV